jgi:hypothetical protein
MPIIFNGTTFNNGGTILFNGTSLSSVKFGNTQVWQRSVTCTDLCQWYQWSKSGNVNGANEWGEGAVAYNTGIQILSGAPSSGLPAGTISQNVYMTNGHKYWVYYGYYAIGGLGITTPFGYTNYASANGTYSQVLTYTSSSGNKAIGAGNTSGDVTASDYGRLCSMNIVDLTASFGSGKEPTAQWCESNLGIFNGSKTVIPPT